MISKKAAAIFAKGQVLARSYRRSDVELLHLISEIDRERVNLEYGCSLRELCIDRLTLPTSAVLNAIDVLKKSREVPALRAAVERGLELTKARRLVSVITPQNQIEWLERAAKLSKSKLERAVANANPRSREYESVRAAPADRLKIEYYTSIERAADLRRAQDLVSSRRGTNANLDETISLAVSEYLARHDPVVRADRNVHRANASLKTKVFARDRNRCQMKVHGEKRCGNRRHLQMHHKHAQFHGGVDHLDNLTTLCAKCHRDWHRRHGDVPLYDARAPDD